DILLEKFLEDDSQRSTGLVRDRPLVAGDITALPFKTQSVDFVIASHILEHIEEPAVAIAELQRVAPAGYIETPTWLAEQLMSHSAHLWGTLLDGDTLVFRRKRAAVIDSTLHGIFARLVRTDAAWNRFVLERMDLFANAVFWKGAVSYRIEA